MIVDPTKVNFTDLTGQERVGVINRNTKEKVEISDNKLRTLLLSDKFMNEIFFMRIIWVKRRLHEFVYHTT